MTTQATDWLGKIIRVRVKSVCSFGAVVETESGLPGLIRRRELSWDETVNPRLVLRPGDEIEAVAVRASETPLHLELSYRRVQYDPWREFVAYYTVGAAVRGYVKQLHADGAYVSIAPGVDGWLPLREIEAPRHGCRIHDILWLGDAVEATITHLDERQRRVRLSLRKRSAQLGRETSQRLLRTSAAQSLDMSIGERTGITPDALKAQLGHHDESEAVAADPLVTLPRPLHILVVDDEAGIRDTLSERLERVGCRCALAGTAAEARRMAEQGVFDLILVDVGLPDEDGIALAEALHDLQHRRAVIAVITGIPSLADGADRFEAVASTVVLLKPLDWAEVNDLLQAVARGEPVRGLGHRAEGQMLLPSAEVPHTFRGTEPMGYRSEGLLTSTNLEIALRPHLSELRKTTGARLATVFAMDPLTRAARLVTQVGQPLIRYDPSSHPLEISPVKDVIIDRELLFESDVPANAAARFRYLQPLVNCTSCIGVPLMSEAAERYGLFLFHAERAAFSVHDLALARATAIALAGVIERVHIHQLLRQSQNLLLQGQLIAGLGHEVNNKLTKIALKAQNLADGCTDLENRSRDLLLSRGLAKLTAEARELYSWCRGLSETVRQFQALMKHTAGNRADVNRAVLAAQRILAPTAEKHKVRLHLELADATPHVPASDVRLEHICLNIMINAVQQIAAYSPAGGTLHMSTEYVPGDGCCPVKVRFRDDGPGIHRQWFERIFDFGFTSRPGGSGLGLYITRSLVEAIGGHVRVEDSTIFGGTTFLVELPVFDETATDG